MRSEADSAGHSAASWLGLGRKMPTLDSNVSSSNPSGEKIGPDWNGFSEGANASPVASPCEEVY